MFSSRSLIFGALGAAAVLLATGLPVTASADAEPIDANYVTRADSFPLTVSGVAVASGWHRRVEGDTNMVGLAWSDDRAARFSVEVRDTYDHWRNLGEVEGPEGEGPDPDSPEGRNSKSTRHISPAVWVGDAESVRVRLLGGTARNVVLETVQIPSVRSDGPITAASVASPSIISRPQWGADEQLRLANCPEGPVVMDAARFAVVHHTAGSNNYGPADSARIVRGLYAYATQTLRYCDTHYNFFVDKFGQIFEGRYGTVNGAVLGAHAIGFNWGSVGVAMIGDYTSAAPPPVAMASLEWLLASQLAWHGVDPNRNVVYTTSGNDRFSAGTSLSIPYIITHGDSWFTSCPGAAFNAQMNSIRSLVMAAIVHAPTDRFPTWTPSAGVPQVTAVSAFGAFYPGGSAPWVEPPGTWAGWPIVRDATAPLTGSGSYVLDGWGGIHPYGGAPQLAGDSPYWRGWDIARDLVMAPGGGGYVLDGYGGIHRFGGAPQLAGDSPYWRGFDIARRLVLARGGGGYVLDGYGGIHRFGGAPAISGGPYWLGADVARDLVESPNGMGLYLLDANGGVWAIAGAPPAIGAPYYGAGLARVLVMMPTGGGYSLSATGVVTAFGGAAPVLQARSTWFGAPSLMSPWVARALVVRT